MIIYINRYFLKPGTRDAFIEELNASGFEQTVRSIEGCDIFQLSASVSEPDTICLADAWSDEKAFEAHLTCDAIPAWQALKDKYVIGDDVSRYDF